MNDYVNEIPTSMSRGAWLQLLQAFISYLSMPLWRGTSQGPKGRERELSLCLQGPMVMYKNQVSQQLTTESCPIHSLLHCPFQEGMWVGVLFGYKSLIFSTLELVFRLDHKGFII